MALLPGIVQIVQQGHMASGQSVINSFYIQRGSLSSVPDLPTMQTLVDDLETYLGPQYRAVGTTSYTHDAWLARNVDGLPPKTAPGEVSHPVNLPGTRAVTGGNAPESLCGVLSFKTVFASRRARGHNFMHPIINTAELAGNNLDTTKAYYTAMGTYAARLDDGCSNPTPTWTGAELHNWSLVIFSRTTLAASAGAQSAYAMRSIVPKAHVSFLRSRERGGS